MRQPNSGMSTSLTKNMTESELLIYIDINISTSIHGNIKMKII